MGVAQGSTAGDISIHALLAESDGGVDANTWWDNTFLSTLSLRRATRHSNGFPQMGQHFYPRSPCGERQWEGMKSLSEVEFLSTLSLRRATLAARDDSIMFVFLSTLSLRRATGPIIIRVCYYTYFYPRSPCGERLYVSYNQYNNTNISIHALLAESDHSRAEPLHMCHTFLSTLSLRRATSSIEEVSKYVVISIHALLAESDKVLELQCILGRISIHALLAESDLATWQSDYLR